MHDNLPVSGGYSLKLIELQKKKSGTLKHCKYRQMVCNIDRIEKLLNWKSNKLEELSDQESRTAQDHLLIHIPSFLWISF